MSLVAINSRLRGAISGGWKVVNLQAVRKSELAPTKEILLLASLLILIQIIDGIFTGFGVMLYGPSIEANPIIRSLILSWGTANALIFIKTLAIFIIFGLVWLSTQVSWMPRALKTVICVYMVSAVIPWSLILVRHL